jgi:hypothetical protein
MHWSKSRHLDYEGCPRRYFYGAIAAPRNPTIKELTEKRSAPLTRQEIVRRTIASLVRKEQNINDLPKTLEQACTILKKIDAARATSEVSIVEACVRGFEKAILPSAAKGAILHVSDGNPIEFVYDELRIFVMPELVIETHDAIEIFVWRTGDPRYRRNRDHWLKAGGLTCYGRVVLQQLHKPIKVTEVYLQPPIQQFPIVHDDGDLKAFVEEARSVASLYTISEKIKDFPAQPSAQTCRFCPFTTICPEYEEFAETDFSLEALRRALRERKAEKQAAQEASAGEVKPVFLCHITEDKKDYVLPFARALDAAGIDYWLDEGEILWGDGLVSEVNKGLAIADCMIVFLSDQFLEAGWPKAEFGAAMGKNLKDGNMRVLPLFISGKEKIIEAYPMLGDTYYLNWDMGIEKIVKELKKIRNL